MKKDSPSSTAIAVCSGVAYAGLSKKNFVDAEIFSLSMATLQKTRRIFALVLLLMSKFGILRTVGCVIESLTVRGISAHFVLRKKTIKKIALKELENCEQCLVLAGGFDFSTAILALQFPKVQFFETDHPNTQNVKQEVLQEHGLQPNNLHLIPIDYTVSNLQDSLVSNSQFKIDALTLIIAEGLLMYLQQAHVDELFQTVRSICGAGSPIVFTTMVKEHTNSRVRFATQSKFLDLWMSQRKEPFCWGLIEKDITSFLERRGFKHEGTIDHVALERIWQFEKNLARGEVIVRARTKASSDPSAPNRPIANRPIANPPLASLPLVDGSAVNAVQ